MVNSVPVMLIVGTALGFLSALGIGGGSLLILWLTVAAGEDPSTARLINLLFFLPSALIACTLRIRSGELKVRPVLPAIISGCIGAVLFSLIGAATGVGLLKKLFGTILIVAGLRELFYRPRNAR